MKRKRKTTRMIIALLILGLTMSVNLEAQERELHRPPMPPDSAQIEKMISDLTEQLSLSTEQQVKVKELTLAHFEDVKPMMEKGKAEHDQQREKMEAKRRQFEDQIAQVLNKDQLDGWKQFMESHRPKRGMKPDRKH